MNIAHARLLNQRLWSNGLRTPTDIVRWFGAMQAQDFPGAKWGVGQRVAASTDAALEKAFATGAILRTHVLRPTWHFVTPRDIRWLLDLTAPRVLAGLRSRHRELELDEQVFRRAGRVLARALRGGTHLTRAELRETFTRAGIATEGQRLAHILMQAELEGLICSGPRAGTQFTYALLDERAPRTDALTREEALAELTRRYFTSHGPATLRDFSWWSGLTMADARAGVAMIRPRLVEEVIDGTLYWFPASMPAAKAERNGALLLPAFDEYLVAYRNRGATLDPAVVVDGRVVGTWKKGMSASAVVIKLMLFEQLRTPVRREIERAVERFGMFLGVPAVIGEP